MLDIPRGSDYYSVKVWASHIAVGMLEQQGLRGEAD